MWPSHFRQFSSIVTKMSDMDWDVLKVRDPKVIQSMIDKLP